MDLIGGMLAPLSHRTDGIAFSLVVESVRSGANRIEQGLQLNLFTMFPFLTWAGAAEEATYVRETWSWASPSIASFDAFTRLPNYHCVSFPFPRLNARMR